EKEALEKQKADIVEQRKRLEAESDAEIARVKKEAAAATAIIKSLASEDISPMVQELVNGPRKTYPVLVELLGEDPPNLKLVREKILALDIHKDKVPPMKENPNPTFIRKFGSVLGSYLLTVESYSDLKALQ